MSSSRLTGGSERVDYLHAPSAAIVVKYRSIVVLDSGLHATTRIPIGKSVAVQSGGGAIQGKKDRVSDYCDNMGS